MADHLNSKAIASLKIMNEFAIYGGLFVAALTAAALRPAQSKVLVVGLLKTGYAPWLVLVVASIGNVLRSVVNWYLGRGTVRFRNRRWFPISPAAALQIF